MGVGVKNLGRELGRVLGRFVKVGVATVVEQVEF